MIPVTKPFLPPKTEYMNNLNTIWENSCLTNHGPLVQKLEKSIVEILNLPNIHFLSNGTIALQIAINALDLKGDIITTPFSFVATTTSIIWENCNPVFVDIRPDTYNIDTQKIEERITKNTVAILATHVYGIPCDVDKIDEIAKKYNLKVIYDAAHSFGVQYKGKSLLTFGDLSIISFHATKVFHTVEGGGIVNNGSNQLDEKIKSIRNFGMQNGEYNLVGINGKNSEFHAAMGLSNLKYIKENLLKRKCLSEIYNKLLPTSLQISIPTDINYNYAYYPILLKDEVELLEVERILSVNHIQSRRYFRPSLNRLPYIKGRFSCPISENISNRVLCLPLYADLGKDSVIRISELVNSVVGGE